MTQASSHLAPCALGHYPVWAGSVPHVFLVPFNLVLARQRAQLVLKSNLAVMRLLSGDVLLHLFEIRLSHGEIRVAALPLEVGVIATAKKGWRGRLADRTGGKSTVRSNIQPSRTVAPVLSGESRTAQADRLCYPVTEFETRFNSLPIPPARWCFRIAQADGRDLPRCQRSRAAK